jgi:hypothetical protein
MSTWVTLSTITVGRTGGLGGKSRLQMCEHGWGRGVSRLAGHLGVVVSSAHLKELKLLVLHVHAQRGVELDRARGSLPSCKLLR